MIRIDLFQIREHIEAGDEILFLDTRSERNWQTATQKIEDAKRLSPRFVEDAAQHLPADAVLVTYCTTPAESVSVEVAETLREMGFERAYALQGGFHLWRMADYPLETVAHAQSEENGTESV
jgi:rhodanese-related sulfurtransferase